MTVKEPPNKRGGQREVFASKPFTLSQSVAKRLGATDDQMAAYIGVTLRTYQRRAQKGGLEDAESAKVEMLDALLSRFCLLAEA